MPLILNRMLLVIIWYFFHNYFWPRPRPQPPEIGLDLGLVALASASRFWPCLTSLTKLNSTTSQALSAHNHFYARQHICCSAYMLSPFRLSVWLKLGLWNFHHTVAPSLYFLWDKFHPEIPRGSPRARTSNKGGVGKISSFLSLSMSISKKVADTAKVTINGFPLIPRSMTLDDIEPL